MRFKFKLTKKLFILSILLLIYILDLYITKEVDLISKLMLAYCAFCCIQYGAFRYYEINQNILIIKNIFSKEEVYIKDIIAIEKKILFRAKSNPVFQDCLRLKNEKIPISKYYTNGDGEKLKDYLKREYKIKEK